jgi:two-component system KDP operon response regulator KdpE
MNAPTEAIPRGAETILLVDPDPQPRKLAGFMLSKQGYTIREARSAADALRLLGGEDIDLVLTELHLPQMSGRDLARRIEEQWPATRVLFMSDPDYANFLARCVIPKSLDYVAKPFTMRSLAARVRRALDEPRKPAAVVR